MRIINAYQRHITSEEGKVVDVVGISLDVLLVSLMVDQESSLFFQ